MIVATVEAIPLIATERKLVELDAVALLMILLVAVTPFVPEVNTLPVVLLVTEVTTAVVLATPFTVVVKVLPDTEAPTELITVAMAEVTPLMTDWKVLVVVAILLVKTIDDVATLPFTVEVNVFDAAPNTLVVELATAFDKSVVVATPFTVLVSTDPLVPNTLEDMTLLVALTPFTVEVKTFPVTD